MHPKEFRFKVIMKSAVAAVVDADATVAVADAVAVSIAAAVDDAVAVAVAVFTVAPAPFRRVGGLALTAAGLRLPPPAPPRRRWPCAAGGQPASHPTAPQCRRHCAAGRPATPRRPGTAGLALPLPGGGPRAAQYRRPYNGRWRPHAQWRTCAPPVGRPPPSTPPGPDEFAYLVADRRLCAPQTAPAQAPTALRCRLAAPKCTAPAPSLLEGPRADPTPAAGGLKPDGVAQGRRSRGGARATGGVCTPVPRWH